MNQYLYIYFHPKLRLYTFLSYSIQKIFLTKYF